MSCNIVNFGLLTAEICWRVWGTAPNFNGFRVLAALMHGTLVVGVSQTLRHWTEGATYIRQSGHHVGHWPTFLVLPMFLCCIIANSRQWSRISYLWTPCGLGIVKASALEFHQDIWYNKTVANLSLSTWGLVQPFWCIIWVWRIYKA